MIEVRVPKAGRFRTISGYFQDHARLAQAAGQLEPEKFAGIYWTLNPVKPELLARADHKLKRFAEATTSDNDVTRRVWLPIDFDPKRAAGISSTDAEHDAALALADRMRMTLAAEGWPDPVCADSGNGAHLLYPIDLPNDPLMADLVKRCLEALASRFDTAAVSIDRTTYNASRIFKIYGTTARKGDATADRPHRFSQLLQAPASLALVSGELLRLLAASAPIKQRRVSRSATTTFRVEEFLHRHGIRYHPPVAFEGGQKFVLEECPFDSSHKGKDAAVFERSDGPGFHCFHNSCADRQWSDFRELFEPGYREAAQRRASRSNGPPVDSSPASSADGRDEIPLGTADVEAAIDAAISAADLAAAMRLIPEIAQLPIQSQVLIQAKLRLKFKREFPARDFARAVRGIAEKRSELPPRPPDEGPDDVDPEAPDLTAYPLTDSGNGERLVALHGRDFRYCVEMRKFLVWDGRRWKVDEEEYVTQKAKQMARLLHRQAARVPDSGLRKALEEHARASESQAAIMAALKRAASEPGIPVSAAQLDQHRYLLNCLNGVLDIRTGELLQFERHYLITKLCHVKYNPEAKCPRFLKFIHWAMGATPDDGEERERVTRLVNFQQKAFGLALSGDVSEKAVFVFYGRRGNNGKTTLLNVFSGLLSEYSAELDVNTLMTTKLTDNNMRADLAALHGARFVKTSEMDDQQKLSERLVKYLTAGMGEIVACRKFENPIRFPATHKLFMDTNHRPLIRGTDEAIWGRLKCIPFEQRMEEDDPQMDKKLKDKILAAESEGVLAWAVRGAMRWVKDGGLGDPPEVKDANTAWRDSNDPLKDFLDECCETGDPEEGYWVVGSRLSAAYDQWCKDNHEKYPLGRSQLIERLGLKGFTQSRSRRDYRGKQIRTWEGLTLKDGAVTPAAGSELSGDPS